MNWAEHEIELAKKRNDTKEYAETLDNAYRAYKIFKEEKYSPWDADKILQRLLNHDPLTPIEESDFSNEVDYTTFDGAAVYGCNRRSSMSKKVYPNGSVIYSDITRMMCIDINDDIPYTNGRIIQIVEEKFPIVFPYIPPEKPYIIYTDELRDESDDRYDFSHTAILYVMTPNGDKVPMDIYFDWNTDCRITKEEFYRLKAEASCKQHS